MRVPCNAFFTFFFFSVVFLHLHSGSSNNIEIFRKELYKNNFLYSEKRKSHTHVCLHACTYTLFLWVGFDFGNTVCYLLLTLKRIWFWSHRLAAAVRIATSLRILFWEGLFCFNTSAPSMLLNLWLRFHTHLSLLFVFWRDRTCSAKTTTTKNLPKPMNL